MNYKGNSVECLTQTKKHLIDKQIKRSEASKAKASAGYINMRMEQLAVERDNPHNNEIDSKWYNRIIQELDWAQQAINKTAQRNCFMEKK
jgi:hypothetical protein